MSAEYELFKDAEPLEINEITAQVGNDSGEAHWLVIICEERNRVTLDTNEARALRDWLDTVIP